MTNRKLISIVIPAYNVANYIEECIESIEKQSFQNIEIIVVNDGSTDNTLDVLNGLARKNTKIVLVDKNNEGVSRARNVGIQRATGDYIVFVDADDYLASDYLDYMYNLVVHSNSDFGLSLNCFSDKSEKQVDSDNIRMISNDEAVALLLSPRVVVGCWNKIYKKSILIDNEIVFNEQLFYGEGLSFIIEVAKKANSIAVGNRKVYFYRKNNASSATTHFDIKKIYNGEHSIDLIEANLGSINSKSIIENLLLHRCMFYAGAIVRIVDARMKNDYKRDYNNWLGFIRKNYSKILKSKTITLYRKGLLLGVLISPSLIAKLDRVRRARIYRRSI